MLLTFKNHLETFLMVGVLAVIDMGSVGANEAEDVKLAKKLQNPVAALISVPVQFDYDSGIGPKDGSRTVLNIQPVIPFSLNDDWNIISKTYVPFVRQKDIGGYSGSKYGLGDIIQSVILSPNSTNGPIWGIGAVAIMPTATDELLSAEKWGLGPTGVVFGHTGPWTYGILANHIWSFAGDSTRRDISATLVQPFFAYTTNEALTFGLQTTTTYGWINDEWAVPIQANVSKITTIGNQLVSFAAGVRYWAEPPANGPEGVGVSFRVTFLFPK
jgi:hypothetical protein